MSRRRAEAGAPALLCVDKSAGPTSFDVVRAVRRATGRRRVGHAGTLDPFATGVLVVGLGAGTRLLDHLRDEPKSYRASIRFGESRVGHDPTGEVTATAPVRFGEAELRAACGAFVGEIDQVPPRLSAIKVDGRRSYDRFRRGETDLALAPRRVRIDRIEPVEVDLPHVEIDVACGSGTYIRALARDLGRALDCPAHLRSLRRTAVGPFTLSEAIALCEIEADGLRPSQLLAPEVLARIWPCFVLDPERVIGVRQGLQPDPTWGEGQPLPPDGQRVALLDEHERLVAVARVESGSLRLATVLPEAS